SSGDLPCLFGRPLVQARPVPAFADSLHVGRGLSATTPHGIEKIVGHVGSDLVTDCRASAGCRVQKLFDCGARCTGRNEQIHQQAHVGAAMRLEDLAEAPAIGAATPPPTGGSATIATLHTVELSGNRAPLEVAPCAPDTIR